MLLVRIPLIFPNLTTCLSMPSTQKLFRCDFCGQETEWVGRVAVAPGYDRLYSAPKYACKACHEQKERDRKAGKGTELHPAAKKES